MDYTPISPIRMLLAFALTIAVGIAPVFAIALHGKLPGSIAGALGDGYGGLVLGLGSIAVAVTLIGFTWLTVVLGRRVTGRPSRV